MLENHNALTLAPPAPLITLAAAVALLVRPVERLVSMKGQPKLQERRIALCLSNRPESGFSLLRLVLAFEFSGDGCVQQ